MEQITKNTVSAVNQLKESEQVRYINPDGKGKKILFVGNSITLHGVKPEIGWYGYYGMAASSEDKDYVHILAKRIAEKTKDPAFCVCQVASWERNYKDPAYDLSIFDVARAFGADIIIIRILENCRTNEFDPEIFTEAYKKFIDYFNSKGNAQIILTTSFWKHTGDSTVIKIAEERGYAYAYLGDLGEDDSMKAIGLFDHDGVANHPGDKGMAAIADAIEAKINL